MPGLVRGVEPDELGPDRSTTFATALQDALAAVARLVAVAQLDGLVARRSRRPTGPPPGRPSRRRARRRPRSSGLPRESRISRASTPSIVVSTVGAPGSGATRRPPRARRLRGSGGRSWRTAMPGSSRPSRNSSEAPPPVRDVGHLRSARPCCWTAATESPPPTTTVAPASALSARKPRHRPRAVRRTTGISKTPSGPFQNTVSRRFERLLHEVERLLADVDDVPARRGSSRPGASCTRCRA